MCKNLSLLSLSCAIVFITLLNCSNNKVNLKNYASYYINNNSLGMEYKIFLFKKLNVMDTIKNVFFANNSLKIHNKYGADYKYKYGIQGESIMYHSYRKKSNHEVELFKGNDSMDFQKTVFDFTDSSMIIKEYESGKYVQKIEIKYNVQFNVSTSNNIVFEKIEDISFGKKKYKNCLRIRFILGETPTVFWVSKKRGLIQYLMTVPDGYGYCLGLLINSDNFELTKRHAPKSPAGVLKE